MTSTSVAIATFNGAKYLPAQLDSLKRQTISPDQIVITDDDSTDNTLELIRNFQENSGLNVEVYQNFRRLGYRENFMRAASLCTADLIAFCDQDDIWLPKKIERCLSEFSDPSLLMCHHDAFLIRGNLEKIGIVGNEGISKFPMEVNMIRPLWTNPRGFTQIFRSVLLDFCPSRELTIDHRSGDTQLMAHDQWFYFLATCLGKTVFVDEKLALYRQHSENVVGLDATSQRTHLISQAANGFTEFSRREQAAKARSRALKDIVNTIAPDSQLLNVEQARKASSLYERLTTVYNRRKQVYQRKGKVDAFEAILKNLIEGWYVGFGPLRLGAGPLAKDLLFAVNAPRN